MAYKNTNMHNFNNQVSINAIRAEIPLIIQFALNVGTIYLRKLYIFYNYQLSFITIEMPSQRNFDFRITA